MPSPAAVTILGLLLATQPVNTPAHDAAGVPEPRPALLLADESATPGVRVRWTSAGRPRELVGERPFGAPNDAAPFEGSNLAASVSLGGTRLERGAGHPEGALLRVELRKIEPGRALFAGIDPGSSVTLEVRGARFNQPVRVRAATAIVHLRYALGDLEACALPSDAANQYLLSDPEDTLGGIAKDGDNARAEALGGGPGRGRAEAVVESDGSVRLTVTLPYALLRHPRDPWASELPGTFFEPVRLHAEVEVVPVGVPEDPDPD